MATRPSSTKAASEEPGSDFSLPFEVKRPGRRDRGADKLRLLIADDDGVSRKVLGRMLEDKGYELSYAKTGTEALGVILRDSPQIVVSDWMMPGITGIELCRHVRDRRATSYTYIVLLTAKTGRDHRLEALQAGADDFLSKPIDPAELEASLLTAKRILAMQDELRTQRDELLALRDVLEERNHALENKNAAEIVAAKRYSSLFQELPVPCFACDDEGRAMEINGAAGALYGYSPLELFQQSVVEVFGFDAERDATEAAFARARSGEFIRDYEWRNRCRDGRVILVQSSIVPIEGSEGSVIGLVVASVDVTDRRAYEKALAEKAITDGLTGLRNHRHFRERLDEEFEVSCEYGSPLSVVLLDVDHFKQYNDSFGHPAGDDVLRGVAAILAENAPEGALVSRYGGEEFVILAPGLDDDAVFEVAEKIRAALEAREWPNRAITASFGFSTFGPGFPTAADLVDSADKALYESKRSGRNRVTHFESLPAAA